ncbi:MAG: hypothetical protein AB1346_02995 [Thermodesulfobacteriota bacterium]
MADFVFSIAGSREVVAAFALLGAAALLYAAVRISLFAYSSITGEGGKAPFILEAADAIYDPAGAGTPPVFRKEALDVFGIGGCFLETLTLRVTATEDTTFENIRVEFAERRFGRLARVRPGEYRVEGLAEAGRTADDVRRPDDFPACGDGAGAFEGRFTPPSRLPAGGTLWLRVGYKIDVAREGSCLLVFRQLREGKRERAASIRLAFRNREPIDA